MYHIKSVLNKNCSLLVQKPNLDIELEFIHKRKDILPYNRALMYENNF